MSLEKSMKQIRGKPTKLKRFAKFNVPEKKKTGKANHPCRNCGRTRGVIVKYSLVYCRQCFRERAVKLGFSKFN